VLSVVKGKLWVAQRVPDDEIMTITDRFNIGEIDLDDHDNLMGSEKLVRRARWKGWYKPRRDGAFNFANAYSEAPPQA
jgi:dipeptidase